MPPPSALPILVVCALIVDGTGRVLVAQRPPDKHLGLKWEFPGGKVELGETVWEALRREIQEELGAAISPLPTASELSHVLQPHGSIVIELIPLLARLEVGSPVPVAREHVELRWIHWAELAMIDFAPGDWRIATEWAGRQNTGP